MATSRPARLDEARVVGKMVIELIGNGTSRPHPRVSFDPVGQFTPGLIGDYVTHFSNEVQKAQAKVRHELLTKQRKEIA